MLDNTPEGRTIVQRTEHQTVCETKALCLFSFMSHGGLAQMLPLSPRGTIARGVESIAPKNKIQDSCEVSCKNDKILGTPTILYFLNAMLSQHTTHSALGHSPRICVSQQIAR